MKLLCLSGIVYKPDCRQHEEFKLGSDCDNRCEDIANHVKCDNSLETGCYCKVGYYRESGATGKCVKERFCKKKLQKKMPQKKDLIKWF